MAKISFKGIALLFLIGISTGINAMDDKWFQTWDRVEYQEWALEIPEGYLLHIIRNEKNGSLVVEAKLIMGDKGLPGFEVIKEQMFSDATMAFNCIQQWKSDWATVCVGK